MSLTDLEKAGLVARIENETGIEIAEVQEIRLAEPARGGTCAWCGAEIAIWFCAKWCDDCVDAWLAEPNGRWANAREFFTVRDQVRSEGRATPQNGGGPSSAPAT